jgi:hypothetical protein
MGRRGGITQEAADLFIRNHEAEFLKLAAFLSPRVAKKFGNYIVNSLGGMG